MKNILLKIKESLFPQKFEVTEKKVEEVSKTLTVSVKCADEDDIKQFTGKEKVRSYDEVYFTGQTNNLRKMLKVAELEKSPSKRHFLLQDIVSEAYRLRKEEKYKNLCLRFCEKHVEEFEGIFKSLKEEFEGFTPIVTTFQYYSTLLTELEEYYKAIKVCELALSYKLDDGTQGGYNGRIKRIKKKMSFDELKVFDTKNTTSFPENNLLIEENKLSEVEYVTEYSDSQIMQIIGEIVREAQDTAKVDTGFLKRSIRGNLFKGKITFRQIYYGAKNGNSKLLEIATNKMPKDLKWNIILIDDEGREIFRKA